MDPAAASLETFVSDVFGGCIPPAAVARVCQVLAPHRAGIGLAARTRPPWKLWRHHRNSIWNAFVLSVPAVDRAVCEAVGPQTWLPAAEKTLLARYETWP
ncbi:MAG: hypothetical protein K2X82_08415 [Gemmataceae bacterium]|nr:hypothetical protein [Gemmataceae bacterium]